ncbi:signal peptide-containing protein [Cryptosporidium canis]|uniref:Signal peptide-containing protein n=1 Tax=Cryptosporidium canis TaxID=195482 RepID=A0A9D5DI13_9CRYT|nr:signal peptide-containing protein [Cryptosporidium canis]
MRVGKVGETLLILVFSLCFLILNLDLTFIYGVESGIKLATCTSAFDSNEVSSENLDIGLEILKNTIKKPKDDEVGENVNIDNRKDSGMDHPVTNEKNLVRSTLTESEVNSESEVVPNNKFSEEDFEKDDSSVPEDHDTDFGFLTQSLGPSFGHDQNMDSEIDSETADSVIKAKMKNIKDFNFNEGNKSILDSDNTKDIDQFIKDKSFVENKVNSNSNFVLSHPSGVSMKLNNQIDSNTNTNKDQLPTFYYPGSTGISRFDVSGMSLNENTHFPRPVMRMNNIGQAGAINKTFGSIGSGSYNVKNLNPRVVQTYSTKKPQQITIQAVSNPQPKQITLQAVAKPQPQQITLQAVPQLKPKQITLQAVAKPKPQPKQITLQAVAKPQPKQITLQAVAQPKPQPKQITLQAVTKPQPKKITLQAVPRPQPKQITLQAVAKPQPKQITLQAVAKPQPKQITLQAVPQPKPKQITLQAVAKPQPQQITLQAVPQLKPKQITLQAVAQPKPQPKQITLQAVAKPQPKQITLQAVAQPKPQPKQITLQAVAKPQPKQITLQAVAQPKLQPKQITLQAVTRPQPKQITLQAVPKPQPKQITLQAVAQPKPQPQQIVLQTIPKPKPRQITLQAISKPKPQTKKVILQEIPKEKLVQPKKKIILRKVDTNLTRLVPISRNRVKTLRLVNSNKQPRLIPLQIVGNKKPQIRRFIEINDKDDNTSNMEIKLPYSMSNIKTLRRNEPFQLIDDPSLRYGPNVKRKTTVKRLIPIFLNRISPSRGSHKLLESDITLSKDKLYLPKNYKGKKVEASEQEEEDEEDGDKHIKLIRVNKNNNKGDVKYIKKDVVLEPKYIYPLESTHNGRVVSNMHGNSPHANNMNAINQRPRYGIPMFPMPKNNNDQENKNNDRADCDEDIGEFQNNSINEFRDKRPWYLQSAFIFSFIGIIFLLIIGAIAIYYIAA